MHWLRCASQGSRLSCRPEGSAAVAAQNQRMRRVPPASPIIPSATQLIDQMAIWSIDQKGRFCWRALETIVVQSARRSVGAQLLQQDGLFQPDGLGQLGREGQLAIGNEGSGWHGDAVQSKRSDRIPAYALSIQPLRSVSQEFRVAKAKTAFVCNDCGADFPKWQGQCGECQAWNTLTEIPLECAGGEKCIEWRSATRRRFCGQSGGGQAARGGVHCRPTALGIGIRRI